MGDQTTVGNAYSTESKQDEVLVKLQDIASRTDAPAVWNKLVEMLAAAVSANTKSDTALSSLTEIKDSTVSLANQVTVTGNRADYANQRLDDVKAELIISNSTASDIKNLETAGNLTSEDIKARLDTLNNTQTDAITKFEGLLTFGGSQATGDRQDYANQRLDNLVTDQSSGNQSLLTLVAQDAATGARSDYANQRLDEVNTKIQRLIDQQDYQTGRLDRHTEQLDYANDRLKNLAEFPVYSIHASAALPLSTVDMRLVVNAKTGITGEILEGGAWLLTAGGTPVPNGIHSFTIEGFTGQPLRIDLVGSFPNQEVTMVVHHNGASPVGMWCGLDINGMQSAYIHLKKLY